MTHEESAEILDALRIEIMTKGWPGWPPERIYAALAHAADFLTWAASVASDHRVDL